jgi:hypothetical protein
MIVALCVLILGVNFYAAMKWDNSL